MSENKPRRPKGTVATPKPMKSTPRGPRLDGPQPKKGAPPADPNVPGRPGHNGGGWLRTGNPGNINGAGPKPQAVRQEMLRTVEGATEVMRSILDGEFKVEMRDMFGKVVGYRTATIKELATVFECLAKHALPAKQEISGPDGAPIQTNGSNATDALLDAMSPEDLAEHEAILRRANAKIIERANAARDAE